MHYRPAELDQSKLQALQALESDLGKTVVAVESPNEPASMTPDQLEKLKQAEEQLGVVLVAYER